MSATETIYYFVSINYPFRTLSMDYDSFEKDAKKYKVDVDGTFDLVSKRFEKGVNHEFYIYKFKEPKPASGAVEDDFIVDTLNVHTSKILLETEDCMPIHFDLTTVRSAEDALAKLAGEVIKMAKNKTAYDDMVNRIASLVPAVLKHMDTQADQLPVPSLEAQAIVMRIQPLSHHIPEEMYNEMFFSQVETYAMENGFAVASNKSNVDGTVLQCSQFFRSTRPDLIIYHQESDDQLAAYLLCTSNEQQDTQSDEELAMGESPVTLNAGVTEHKLKVKDNLGQLLAGMEKVAGDIACRHLRKDLSIAKRSFQFIHIYGLLCDLEKRKCRAYKLEMDFMTRQSRLLKGLEMLEISAVVPRLFATLKKQIS